jgi:hypothetical protein
MLMAAEVGQAARFLLRHLAAGVLALLGREGMVQEQLLEWQEPMAA